MKKIKGLLLFGILTLLGIGSSFGDYHLEYYNLSGNNSSFDFHGYNNNSILTWYNSNGVANLLTEYYSTGQCLSNFEDNTIFNLSNYSIVNGYGWNTFSPYLMYNSNGNSFAFIGALYYFWQDFNNPRCQNTFLFPLSNTFSSLNTSTDSIDISNGFYARVNGTSSSCFNSGVFSSSSFCDSLFVEIFGHYKYTISSLGNIQDTVYNGVSYYKGPVSPAIGNGYSFMFVDGSGWLSNGGITYLSSGFHFRSIYFQGSNTKTLNGILLIKLNSNNYRYNSNSNYNVIALGFDSNYVVNSLGYIEYPIIYSIYSCPANSLSVYDCSFVEGGDTNQSFSLGFQGTNTLSYYLTNPNGDKYLKNSYNSNTQTLTLGSYSLILDSTAGDNIIENFPNPDGGNGNQSTGIMAINSGLINFCLTSPSFPSIYDVNTAFCNRVLGGRDISYYQGLISSGAYLQSYVDGSGNLVYVIDIVDEPGVLTGGVVWDCYGDRCINTESGSWGDVEPWEILHLSGGDLLSSGYYLGFFESINETGYFFKCPYSYNNSRFVAGRSILNAIGRDPFLPVNCFIAAFENGRRVKFFDEAFHGYSRGPLMNGDTSNHKNLFTFFDVLLSVALIFFLMKFYHLFK